MAHPDEGAIHAWLDGALSDEDGQDIERHLADCPACSATVAEARGLIAMASRVLTALDDVPGGVVPAAAGPGATNRDRLAELRARQQAAVKRRSWWRRPGALAAAAIVFVAAGTTVVARNAIWPTSRTSMETTASIEPAKALPAADSTFAATMPAATSPAPAPGGGEPPRSEKAERAKRSLPSAVAASPPAPTPVPPVRADSSTMAAERIATAGARSSEARSDAATLRAAAPADVSTPDAATVITLAGCYAIRLVAVGGQPMAIATTRLPTHVALDSTRAGAAGEVAYEARDLSPEGERAPGTYRWRPTGTTSFEFIVLRNGSMTRLAAVSADQSPERRPSTPTPAEAPVTLVATREVCRQAQP
ncbi:MAG: hypothetical protein MNPFHGCM_00284 [Gemmatimonadaceae bacterium]|nr:hypothetical protein [Gemmatimonadaceae bacterium]